jgi:hypothetical protein
VTELIDVKIDASSLGVDFGGNYTLDGDQILSAALDIVGIFDPTPISDAIGSKLAYSKGDYLSAGISLFAMVPYIGDLGKVSKIKKDVEIIKDAVESVKTAQNIKKKGKTFDEAREIAFKKAEMDDGIVEFTKIDPKTGTVVEFKGKNGSKVAYDGPHESPGPHHDTQHIGWQTGGKRSSGGAERGNIPYVGPRHPSRSNKKS